MLWFLYGTCLSGREHVADSAHTAITPSFCGCCFTSSMLVDLVVPLQVTVQGLKPASHSCPDLPPSCLSNQLRWRGQRIRVPDRDNRDIERLCVCDLAVPAHGVLTCMFSVCLGRRPQAWESRRSMSTLRTHPSCRRPSSICERACSVARSIPFWMALGLTEP